MKNKIINLIMDVLVNRYYTAAEDISQTSVYNDLDLDSITLLEIIALLEKELKVRFPPNIITSNMSIEESANYILGNVA